MDYHPRRQRYWVCRKCPTVYHRRKGEKLMYCFRGHKMTAGRVYPYALIERGQERNRRQQEKREQQQKPHLRVRHMRSGRQLVVSPETRLAYHRMAQTGTRKTFQREASTFLVALAEDFFTCHHGIRWPDRCRECKTLPHGYGGPHGTPKVVVADRIDGRGDWTLGIFRRSLLEGIYEIGIKWEGRASIPEMSRTMLHEVVHWMDSYWSRAHKAVGLTTHDKYFNARVEDLEARVSRGVRKRRK